MEALDITAKLIETTENFIEGTISLDYYNNKTKALWFEADLKGILKQVKNRIIRYHTQVMMMDNVSMN